MGSLLVRAMFGERAVGILVWQSGKRSSENGVQTTFWLAGKGSDLEERVRAFGHTRGYRLRLAIHVKFLKVSCLFLALTE